MSRHTSPYGSPPDLPPSYEDSLKHPAIQYMQTAYVPAQPPPVSAAEKGPPHLSTASHAQRLALAQQQQQQIIYAQQQQQQVQLYLQQQQQQHASIPQQQQLMYLQQQAYYAQAVQAAQGIPQASLYQRAPAGHSMIYPAPSPAGQQVLFAPAFDTRYAHTSPPPSVSSAGIQGIPVSVPVVDQNSISQKKPPFLGGDPAAGHSFW